MSSRTFDLIMDYQDFLTRNKLNIKLSGQNDLLIIG